MHMFDLAIIGGGINGCGIAANAALRGLSTVLIEKNDLASHTSSASTKLIHGGLRYLEQYDFKLVKKSLNERQALLHLAPHLIHPVPFVIPHTNNTRHAWLISIGLWIYDHLSQNNKLPKSQRVRRTQAPLIFSPLKNTLTHGHIYYDCVTDDARLTIENALLAKKHDAKILTHTELLQGKLHDHHWILTLQPAHKKPYTLAARTVINAGGIWVNDISTRLGIHNQYNIVLIQGSHLVVKKLYEGDHAYLLQHDDQRVIFAIPFHNHTLIGTTEVPLEHPQDKPAITPLEISYLLNIVNHYFQKQIAEQDIITTWSGVRTLIADNDKNSQTLSRDYILHPTQTPAPALCIYGGKITTYRQLATEAVDCLKTAFPDLPPSSTHQTPLPGAYLNTVLCTTDPFEGGLGIFKKPQKNPYLSTTIDMIQQYPGVPQTLLHRWMNTYGSLTFKFLDNCNKISDLGQLFGADLYQREVDYLIREEWAASAEDILWRRTKLGLSFNAEEQHVLDQYITEKLAV